MKQQLKEQFFVFIAALMVAANHSQAQDSMVIAGSYEVIQRTVSPFKQSLTLKNRNSARMFNIDCLDGRQPSNSILTILPGISFFGGPAHETFTGLSDFYCSGLSLLSNNLKIGDTVEVSLEVSLAQEDAGDDHYQIANVSDVQFGFDDQIRSMKKNPGTTIKLFSKEPIKK